MDPFTSSCCGMVGCGIRKIGFENDFAKVGSSLIFDSTDQLAVDALRCR